MGWFVSPPIPGTMAPPGVSDVSSLGVSSSYALSDHTHASKARKARATGVSSATYAWTYPTAFGTGVVPICNGIVEDPANSANDSYNVQVVGTPSNTGCTFRIIRTTFALGILTFNATPGTINLHLTAFEP